MSNTEKKSSLYTKTALITGASSGIGRAIALRLADDGFFVAINFKDKKTKRPALSLAGELKAKNTPCLLLQGDITKEKDIIRMVKLVKKTRGKLDVLINSAGINLTQNFASFKDRDFRSVLETNLFGATVLTRNFLPLLHGSASPRIIFVSSSNVFIGSKSRTAYVVSKSAIMGLARALTLELAPKVLVNTIVPGYINTNMLRRFGDGASSNKLEKIPLKRFGKPEEVSSVVSFLCSNDASYITGQCIHVNGGLYFS
ncbi:MAG: SDR family oxidoreductase [Parcubacteria group bacterium]|nr:SDR family oxidoreductase [Parcubacteria group bacterium]